MVDAADLIIRNARLIDGTGAPSTHGDIAVGDDRIVGLGDLGHAGAAVEIEAGGQAVAPGNEIASMRHRLEQALEAGAIGLSTGLYYAPAAAAPTSEIIELVTAVRAAGGIHTTHMRDEADRVTESMDEEDVRRILAYPGTMIGSDGLPHDEFPHPRL